MSRRRAATPLVTKGGGRGTILLQTEGVREGGDSFLRVAVLGEKVAVDFVLTPKRKEREHPVFLPLGKEKKIEGARFSLEESCRWGDGRLAGSFPRKGGEVVSSPGWRKRRFH